MQISSAKQIEKLLEKSNDILILLPRNLSGDIIGASFSLSFFLAEHGKKATIVSENRNNKLRNFSFLPQPKHILNELSEARDFILSFNTTKNKIADVRTEEDTNELRILITPQKGIINPQDFSFIPAKFKYDLVFVLGSPDRESLGKTFEDNPDIFYEIPVVNIDNHSSNEEFGQINITNMVASSVCEMLTETLEELSGNDISKNISQCLLTGIIDATESFQNKKTTPRSLQISAKLMDYGADQQDIIRHLYKTQPLHILKLWGKVMANLKWDEDLKLVWSPINLEDFIQSRSNPKDAPFILSKIQENYSSGKMFMLLFSENAGTVKGVLKTQQQSVLEKISLTLNGQIIEDDLCEFSLDNCSVEDAEEKILTILQK